MGMMIMVHLPLYHAILRLRDKNCWDAFNLGKIHFIMKIAFDLVVERPLLSLIVIACALQSLDGAGYFE